MGSTSLNIFLAFISVILVIFIVGITLFVTRYHRKRVQYEKEKEAIERQHRLDLLNTQLQAQDQTMQFIGREIHDSVAQKLTLAALYTQQLDYQDAYPAIAGKLKSISTVLNDSLYELRDLSKTLTDNRLSGQSLEALLQTECGRVNETGTWTATLQYDFSGTFSVYVKNAILRIIQEFIQNSLKHSGGKNISIGVTGGQNGLQVMATDDGKGFDTVHEQSGGIGLSNIERRIKMIGGECHWDSAPGKGTALRFFISGFNLLST